MIAVTIFSGCPQGAAPTRPHALRRTVGYALQSVHLYSASVKENLAFGVEPAPSDEQLREAAAGAQILAEIEAFPEGWDTQIGAAR